jgi:outer membrane protein assembly factor BamB
LLYVGSFDKTLHAFEIETGEEVWTAPAADWIWGAPLYHEGTVYYTDLKGNVYAVDAATGQPIWSGAVSGSVQAAAVLVDGVLYIASTDPGSVENPKGYLTAFRAEDGEPAWATVVTVDAPIHATPVVVGDTLVVAVLQNESSALELIQYDLQTGDKVWSFVPSN